MSFEREWALDGMHDAVWRIAEPLLGKLPCARVIDVGCGPGAFVERLRESGLNCSACDYRSDLAQSLRCDRFYEVDLNQYDSGTVLSADGRYGLAMAVEIIEHLENPWQFMRILNTVLESGGYCVITTPNNQDEASRVDYLAYGELPWFKIDGIEITGHISPVFVQLFYLMMQDANFAFLGHWVHGSVPCPAMNWKGRLVRDFLRRKLMRDPGLTGLNHLWLLQKAGDCSTRIMQKTAPERLEMARRLSRIAPEWL